MSRPHVSPAKQVDYNPKHVAMNIAELASPLKLRAAKSNNEVEDVDKGNLWW